MRTCQANDAPDTPCTLMQFAAHPSYAPPPRCICSPYDKPCIVCPHIVVMSFHHRLVLLHVHKLCLFTEIVWQHHGTWRAYSMEHQHEQQCCMVIASHYVTPHHITYHIASHRITAHVPLTNIVRLSIRIEFIRIRCVVFLGVIRGVWDVEMVVPYRIHLIQCRVTTREISEGG